MDSYKVSSYGWSNDASPGSCGYLAPTVLQILSIHKASARVCDLGCGNGALTAEISKKGFFVAGVEIDHQGVEIARASHPSIPFHCLGVHDDPVSLISEHGLFDVVVSTEVIEHLFAPHMLPRFSKGILRENGLLVVSTPYHGYLKNLAIAILGKWDQHMSNSGVATPSHNYLKEKDLRLLNFVVLDAFHGYGRA